MEVSGTSNNPELETYNYARSASENVFNVLKKDPFYKLKHIKVPFMNLDHFSMKPRNPNIYRLDSHYGFKIHIPTDYRDNNFLGVIKSVSEICNETLTEFKILNPRTVWAKEKRGVKTPKQIVIYPDFTIYDKNLGMEFNYKKTQELADNLKVLSEQFPNLKNRDIPPDLKLADGVFVGFGGTHGYLNGDEPNSPFWKSLSTIAVEPDQKKYALSMLRNFDQKPPENWEDASIYAEAKI